MLSVINKLCGRTNAFTFLFYPDDKKDQNLLFDFLANIKVPSCVSPLHDQDINEIDVETGEIEYKKPHFHVVIDYGSGQNKTPSQMFDLIEPIRSNVAIAPLDHLDQNTPDYRITSCTKLWKNENCVKNMRSLLRYFKHLDNPEKHQYLDQEYRAFCGFDIDNRLLSQEDSLVIIKEIKNFVRNEECYLFCDLVDYAETTRPEWFAVLTKQQFSSFITNYMRSLIYKNSGKIEKALDQE